MSQQRDGAGRRGAGARSARLALAGVIAAALAGGAGVGRPARADEADGDDGDVAPLVRVRARTRIELGAVERTAAGVAVSGSVVDDATGEGVEGQRVRIQLGRADGVRDAGGIEARTGPGGEFRVEVAGAGDGEQALRATVEGDADHAPAPPLLRDVDVRRRPVTLRVGAPERVDVTAATLPVSVDARVLERGDVAAGTPAGSVDARAGAGTTGAEPAAEPSGAVLAQPVAVTVHLFLDGRELARAVTDGAGHLDADLPLPRGLAPGARLRLVARSEGDAGRDAATAERPLLIVSPTELTARVDTATPRRGETLTIDGALRDAAGPVGAAAIEINALGAPVAHALTDGAGRYRAQVSTRGARVGATTLVARYEPTVSFRDAAEAPPIAITILPPAPVPLGLYLLAPGSLAVAGAAAWAYGRRPRRWRRHGPVTPPLVTGLVPAVGRLPSASGPEVDDTIDGAVLDATTGAPIAGARLVLERRLPGRGERPPSASVTFDSDGDGRFAARALAPGRYDVVVSAPAYLPERFSVGIPHRGELRGVAVRLEPVRARLLALFERVALPLLPSPEQRFTVTPRELVAHLRRVASVPSPLADLTALVEEGCWSPRPPDASVLDEATRLVALLDAQR